MYEAAPGELYTFRALYLPQLPTREFTDAHGVPHRLIVRALESVRVLVPGPNGPEAAHRTAEPLWRWVREIDGRAGEPAVVFSTGSLDLIEIGTAIAKPDFVLPAFVTSDLATPEDCRRSLPGAVDAGTVERLYEAAVAPLGALFRYLRRLGLTRLGVLGIGPVTPDQAVYKRMLDALAIPIPPGHLEPSFRRKLVVGMNAFLRRLCDREQAIFIDRWARSTHAGEPLPETRVDGVHYTPDAASASAADIIAAFGARTPQGAGARGHTDRAEPADAGAPHSAYVSTPERAIDGSRLAVPYQLAAPVRGMRVLEIGGGEETLDALFRAEGVAAATLANPEAFVVSPNARGGGAAERFDRIIAHDATERLTLSALEQFYARAASALVPDGALVVRAPWNPAHIRVQGRPSTLMRQLRAAFAHVAVWLATPGDPLGTLGREAEPAELDAAGMVLAYAAHRVFDVAELRERLRPPAPLPEMPGALVIRDPVVPDAVAAGAEFAVEIVLENGSDRRLASWGPNPILFGYFWTDPHGEIHDESARVPLPLPAVPRGERRYGLRLKAPGEPGRHGLRIALLQQHVRWFDAGVDVAVNVA
ncbi:MAG TPA: hypothetical protein VK665_05920 [Candidatus Elarobacter sp.]|nr:hypothetical protein [Candidatus Elarobacter sp.]